MARSRYAEIEQGIIKDISINLKRLLDLKGWTQTDLSDKTNLSTSTISDYVNGKTLISPGNLQKIADALHVLKSDIDSSINKMPSLKLIPVIDSICEDALLSEKNIKERVYYPIPDIKQPDYAFNMSDESMGGFGIGLGDIVYMRYAQWADSNGQIVAVIVNQENPGTLRRMIWTEGSPHIQLTAGNDDVIKVLPNQVRVCGIYMGHFRFNER